MCDKDDKKENQKDETEIEITTEDLDEMDKQAEDEMLVIDAEDLDEEPEKIYPGLTSGTNQEKSAYQYSSGKQIKGKGAIGLAANSIVFNSIIGAAGGFAAWLLTEITISRYGYIGFDLSRLILDAAVFSGISGASIGFFIGASEGVICQSKSKAISDGRTGLLFGVIGGIVGGIVGEAIFGSFGISYRLVGLSRFLIRGVGWSILGLIIGISQGFLTPSPEKVRNGIIGGAIGGFLGGVFFQISNSLINSSSFSRFAALVLVGTCVGLFLSLIENIRKEAWLKIIEGPLLGKEFILYEVVTSIGSNPKTNMIVLFKDKSVSANHAYITVVNNKYVIHDCGSEQGTFVNGNRINDRILGNGDEIRVGNTTLIYREKQK